MSERNLIYIFVTLQDNYTVFDYKVILTENILIIFLIVTQQLNKKMAPSATIINHTESVKTTNHVEDDSFLSLKKRGHSRNIIFPTGNKNTLGLHHENLKGYTIKESSKDAKRLVIYQGIIFTTLFVGYASYTYVRKIFSYAAPTLMGLGLLAQRDMGIVNSSQYFAYAISKFLGGILSDKISAKMLFPAGLFISGLTAVAASFSSQPKVWALLWFINGLGQGCGWPACSKLLKKWFSSKQFGTCWSLLTASSNVSGTVGPILAAYCLVAFGWKVAFLVSGSISIAIGVISITLLQDSPKQLSLELPSEEIEVKKQPEGTKENASDSKDHETSEGKSSYYLLLTSPLLWIISVCYLIVFSTKTALSDWAQVFLIQDLGQTQMEASTFSSALETGGFVGGILAGVITDKLNSKLNFKGNPRLLVSALFMVVCAFALHSLIFLTSVETPQIFLSLIGMVAGGALFGPISIFGIVASESFPPAISGASHAVVALAANVGAIVAGYPVSTIAMQYGWKNCFLIFEIFMIAAVAIIIFSRSFHQVKKLKNN